MSASRVAQRQPTWADRILKFLSLVAILLAGLFLMMLALFVSRLGMFAPFRQILQSLFATDSVQAWWYVTRAAGLMAYILLWLSTTWGLAVSSKIFDSWLERMFTFDFHEYLSLLSIGFLALHIVVLLMDQFLPFSVWQILIPFTSQYRPLWVGIGVFSMYITLLVTVTFYMRKFVSMQAFRRLHILSFLAYIGGLFHGLFAGTDSALPITNGIYGFTFLSTLFLTVYWLVILWQRKDEEHRRELLRALEENRRKRRKVWGA